MNRPLVAISAAAGMAVAVLMAAGPASAQPSFNCERAATDAEMMICNDPTLAELDQAIADAYFALVEESSQLALARLRHDQRAHLRDRNACAAAGSDLARVRCLEREMVTRLVELRESLSDQGIGGADLATAPGIVWRQASTESVPGEAYAPADSAPLCAVDLPNRPLIGLVTADNRCQFSGPVGITQADSFHVLIAGTGGFNWSRVVTVSQPPIDAVEIWETGDDRVYVCRAMMEGDIAYGTMIPGDSCAVVSAGHTYLLLSGFEVMAAVG